MLAIRGGAAKILIVDPRPELNGRTLADVASGWELDAARTVRRIITEANASVMNLDLYDIENTWFLAQQDWNGQSATLLLDPAAEASLWRRPRTPMPKVWCWRPSSSPTATATAR